MNKRGRIFKKINITDKIYNVRKISNYYIQSISRRYEHKKIKIDNSNNIPFDGNV